MGILVRAVIVLGLWFCFVDGIQEKITVWKDPSGKYRIVVTWEDEGGFQCRMFTDQKLIRQVLRTTSGAGGIRRPTSDEMRAIEEECSSLRRRRRDTTGDRSKNVWARLVIFPGTKWCGAWNISENDDDLGVLRETDRCCRAHDRCDDFILAGKTKHNLTNNTPITRMSCKCDNEFYDCLSRTNNATSKTVAISYFNILKNPCFDKNYPFSKTCKKYRSMLNLTCVEYERDKKKAPVYQWVKAKLYEKIPVTEPLAVTSPFFEVLEDRK